MPPSTAPSRDTVRSARQAGTALAQVQSSTPGVLRIRDRSGTVLEIDVPGDAVEALGTVLATIGDGHAVRVPPPGDHA
ncbi:hypothetical protein LBMAG42_43010 [Deltaproteobacteria bacterium]|nr:hypothetical protein LBMAG42_43010 [Deltaproteobacteria bacterium]